MTTEVLVVLIASVTSLVVALVSLGNSVITSRQTAHSQQMIESLKNEFARRETANKMSDQYLEESLKALNMALQVIQHLKDVLQVILSAVEDSMYAESAIKHARSAREEVFACYEANLAHLNEFEANVFHTAKNQALAAESLVAKGLEGAQYASEIMPAERQRLLEIRSVLTDCQQSLRDSKLDRLSQRIARSG